MKSAVHTAGRLLDALEEFVERESLLLCAHNFVRMVAVQKRAAPLIARLGQLGSEPGVSALQGRVSALLARRRENISRLFEHRAFLVSERERLAAKRRQLRALSSYRPLAVANRAKRLNAAV